ncbi:tail fiber domain-containing protein [Roseinatronobacter sp. NSM]|uniref:tail fiber domain-containing protein n=1 Tax=Roseinatronobacter sp. NSM TaxID=3457785 RepID=UPI0040357805
MGKSSSAPSPDPRMGEAAVKSAQTGERYLEWMQAMSGVAQDWAEEDRGRYKATFRPLEDRMIADAENHASPERKASAASEAIADVRQQANLGRQQSQRQMAAMGVNPASGRFAAEQRRAVTAESLSAAGASNMARRQVEAVGDAKMADVVNMGRGMAVNPGTSLGLAGNMASSGFGGAMQGHGQAGSIYGQQHNAQMQAWQANQNQSAGIGQGIGMLAGAFMSSKDSKTNKKKSMGVLDAVKDMPVEEWEYKKGMGDGGGRKHIGPYAEDFAEKTGLGNGREISVIDAVGVNMGATKELAAQVDRIESKIDSIGGRKKVKEAA